MAVSGDKCGRTLLEHTGSEFLYDVEAAFSHSDAFQFHEGSLPGQNQSFESSKYRSLAELSMPVKQTTNEADQVDFVFGKHKIGVGSVTNQRNCHEKYLHAGSSAVSVHSKSGTNETVFPANVKKSEDRKVDAVYKNTSCDIRFITPFPNHAGQGLQESTSDFSSRVVPCHWQCGVMLSEENIQQSTGNFINSTACLNQQKNLMEGTTHDHANSRTAIFGEGIYSNNPDVNSSSYDAISGLIRSGFGNNGDSKQCHSSTDGTDVVNRVLTPNSAMPGSDNSYRKLHEGYSKSGISAAVHKESVEKVPSSDLHKDHTAGCGALPNIGISEHLSGGPEVGSDCFGLGSCSANRKIDDLSASKSLTSGLLTENSKQVNSGCTSVCQIPGKEKSCSKESSEDILSKTTASSSSTTSSSPSSSSQPASQTKKRCAEETKPFFDPRRIFATTSKPRPSKLPPKSLEPDSKASECPKKKKVPTATLR